jgi:murein DD-endopeptidase MepM/ murein hydrolase activator NlpD
MNYKILLFLIPISLILGYLWNYDTPPDLPQSTVYEPVFKNQPSYTSDGFDYPVGKPNGKGYYNAQYFTKNNHLGDDWNGVNGGDSDLGDPVFTVANGYVSSCGNEGGGWGNVIRIIHKIDKNIYVESLYGHCQTVLVKPKTFVKRGDKIATIGNNNGMYKAHLHLEFRSIVDMPIGPGYSTNTQGYLNPTSFIKANRP